MVSGRYVRQQFRSDRTTRGTLIVRPGFSQVHAFSLLSSPEAGIRRDDPGLLYAFHPDLDECLESHRLAFARPPRPVDQQNPENRGSLLRASIRESARELGVGSNRTVANWIFNPVDEENEDKEAEKDKRKPKRQGGVSIPEEWPWEEAKKVFQKPDVTPADQVELEWKNPDVEGLVDFLVKEKGFK